MQVVCIAHSGATRVNSSSKGQGPLGLGFPKEAARMACEYLGHPQNRWPQRLGAQAGTQADILLVVALQLREDPCARLC